MNSKNINPRFTLLLLFILSAGILRIANAVEATPWSNFTPIGAMALFGGAYFTQRWKAFAFPLLTLFVGDLFIHTLILNGKYEGRLVIYCCFALIVLIGIAGLRKVRTINIFFSSLAATLTFWLIADLFVWIGGGRDISTGLPLRRDMSGLLQSYLQGLPFAINFLLGTLFYSSVMFGLFEWMQRRFPRLHTVNADGSGDRN